MLLKMSSAICCCLLWAFRVSFSKEASAKSRHALFTSIDLLQVYKKKHNFCTDQLFKSEAQAEAKGSSFPAANLIPSVCLGFPSEKLDQLSTSYRCSNMAAQARQLFS